MDPYLQATAFLPTLRYTGKKRRALYYLLDSLDSIILFSGVPRIFVPFVRQCQKNKRKRILPPETRLFLILILGQIRLAKECSQAKKKLYQRNVGGLTENVVLLLFAAICFVLVIYRKGFTFYMLENRREMY
jgi:hypothetical protein